MNRDLKDTIALCFMLLRDKKFEDIALSGGTCFTSIKSFNNVDEVMEYINTRYPNELLIRKNGRNIFTERIYLHQLRGFKLNEKSVTFLTTVMTGTGSRAGYRYNIRF